LPKITAEVITMASAHTPGPWKVALEDDSEYRLGTIYQNVKPNLQFVCSVPKDCMEEEEESRANATLISSAPEMLEALKAARGCLYQLHVTENHPFYGKRFAQIEEAIEKAEGKT
jgi:hypothetical protein